LLSSYLVAAVIALGFSMYRHQKDLAAYELFLNNSYQHSFNELVTAVNELDTALTKSIYATSPSMLNSVCTQIFGRSIAAQMYLAELPFSNYEVHETAAFLARVGDYAYALAIKTAGGDMPVDTDIENLKGLAEAASTLSSKLIELQSEVGHGTVTLAQMKTIESEMRRSSDKAQAMSIGESFQLIEAEFPETPTLIYDGPYSKHLEDKTPKLIENAAEISAEEARSIAAAFMGVEIDKTTHIGEREGKIPCFMISAETKCGEITVLVTKKGGAVLSAFGNYEGSEASIAPEDAVEIAKNFLNQHGFPNMKESYWTVYNNIALVNFAYVQDGVICYPDLVKVSVALDCGDVVGFEAMGYVTNHHERELPEVLISEEEARQVVSGQLEILAHELAVIPTDGENEVLCHEFKCISPEERHFIVYVDAISGEEEEILMLIEDESGTLTL